MNALSHHLWAFLQILRVSVKDNLDCAPFAPPPTLSNMGLLYADIAFVSDKAFQREIPAGELIERLLALFVGQVRVCHAIPVPVKSKAWRGGARSVLAGTLCPPPAPPKTCSVHGGALCDSPVLAVQILTVGQQVVFELQGVNLRLTVGTVLVDQGGENKEVQQAMLAQNTAFIFTNGGGNPHVVTDSLG